jgi:hypothetical protein
MSEVFDPYFKWLGIPPGERPIDFYRLLGVQQFEADADVISSAADQRTAHIKGFQTGPHEKAARRILAEVSAAEICLLNPETKATYDRKLRANMAAQAPDVRRPPTRAKAGEAGAAAAPAAAKQSSSQRKMLAIGLGTGGVLALLVLLAIVLTTGGSDKDKEVATQHRPKPKQTHVEEQDPAADPKPPEPEARGVTEPPKDPVPPEPAPKDPAPPEPAPKDPVPPEPAPKDPVPPEPAPKEPVPPEPAPKDPTPPEPAPKEPVRDPGAAKPAVKPDEGGGIFGQGEKRLPVPSAEAQQKAEAQIREVFQIGAVKGKEETLALAERLFQGGLETKDDPAARYVLLRMAATMAAKTGDLDRVNKMADRVGEIYDASLVDVKADALEISAKAAGTGPQALAANMVLVQNARALIDEALAADNYAAAGRVVSQVGMPAARRTQDETLKAEFSNRRGEIKRLRDGYAFVEQALAALKADAADAEANLTVGRWYCLEKGNWDKGLPLLAKGSDAALAKAAQRDLAAPQDANAKVDLADAWWALSAEKDRAESAAGLQARAVRWYREALPQLSGLVKAKAVQHIQQAGGTEAAGDYVLVFDGKKSYVGVPNFGYDGTVPITVEAYAVPAAYESTLTVVGNFTRDSDSGSQRGGLHLAIRYRCWMFEMYSRSPSSSYAYPRDIRNNEFLSLGKRVHVAGVFAGQEMKLFVDGQMAASQNSVGVFKPSLLPFLVGADPVKATTLDPLTAQNGFDGVIEAVRISNVARYTQDKFTPPPKLTLDRNTQLLLEFNQGKGDTVPNLAAPKHQAKILGAQWMERAKWEEALKARMAEDPYRRRPRFGN